ncbi:hypothetical protein [Actinoplanes palleronii]|uniref:Uncharacterized protein n=1 Tax=Actinoplanes palleronii TaxID=113570 RepID=A0ABQ4B424_9ACTN|nr:hypothetical protein [Actinoplanes palleronii]GIE65419.1 hypothetical protein Apa02nite_015270 [Actinoplanes palleronii]
MLAEAIRHVLYRRRLIAARAWSDAERRQAAAHNAAVRRIIAQDVPDPAGRRTA